jgi:hypothetical protein
MITIGTSALLAVIFTRRRRPPGPQPTNPKDTRLEPAPPMALRFAGWRRIRLLAIADATTLVLPAFVGCGVAIAVTLYGLTHLSGSPQFQHEWIIGVGVGLTPGVALFAGAVVADLPRQLGQRQLAADELALRTLWAAAIDETDDAELLARLEVFLGNSGRMGYDRAHQVVNAYRCTGKLEVEAQTALMAFATTGLSRHARRAARRDYSAS